LVDRGCSGVSFIPRAKQQGQKTPDLQAIENAGKIFSEVKTINISQIEVNRRHTGGVGSTTNVLPDALLNKLDATVVSASNQMIAHDLARDVKHIVFIVVNFDDFFSKYKTDYFDQIDCHLGQNQHDNLEIIFFNQRTVFHSSISMRHAHVVNEATYPI
jgi:hypothetical protein